VGLFVQEWMDERLSWIPALHNNMTEIIVEARKLWKPELAVINGLAVSFNVLKLYYICALARGSRLRHY